LDSSTGEFSAPVAWDRAAGPDHPVHLSRVLAQRVIQERIAVLDYEEPSVPASAPASASSAFGLSLLCVPLTAPMLSLGLIYLASPNPATRFSNDDLQLLSAIAGLASVAIENARQFERLGSENQRLRAEVQLQHDMIGRGPRMCQV